jgi:hypothetical protein
MATGINGRRHAKHRPLPRKLDSPRFPAPHQNGEFRHVAKKPHVNIARGVRSRKCPYFFGLRFSMVGRMWTNNLQRRRYLPPSSTGCGDVHFELST